MNQTQRQRSVYKLAVVQAAPELVSRARSLAKVATLTAQAAAQGAKLIVFPETFVPGYPFWVWYLAPRHGEKLSELHALLVREAVDIPGPELAPVQDAARKAGVYVSLGVCERNTESSATSLFNTVVLIGPDGELIAKHRKLIPTGPERLVWAQGDGSTLTPSTTDLGRIGMLICWENYMPLARYALYAQGMDILLAPTYDEGETSVCTVRHVAKEGRIYVASASMILHRAHVPEVYGLRELVADREWIKSGDSTIAGPTGELLAGPLREQEGILFAEVNLDRVAGLRWNLDVAGHYARPDLFHFALVRRPLQPLRILDERDTPEGSPIARALDPQVLDAALSGKQGLQHIAPHSEREPNRNTQGDKEG